MKRNIGATITLSITIAMALSIFFARSFAQDTAVLPSPTDQPFKGKIGLTYKDSTPSFPAIKLPPKSAPNVLLRQYKYLRRSNPDANTGPLSQERSSLQQFPCNGTVLAYSRGPAHRAQSSCGGDRYGYGNCRRLSRLL